MEILSSWALVNNNFDWMDSAACAKSEEVFFETKKGRPPRETSAAQKICRSCPVKEDCLKFALDNRFAYGIWGGATPRMRARLLGMREFH